jgi:succinoglycan biosynthesis transport protein ExoP
MVLQRLKETGVTGMLQMSNVRILDRAEPPDRPVRPRAVRNILLAVLLGGVLGVGLAFLLEMLDTSISTREQIEERLRVPFLGIIPNIPTSGGVVPELAVFSAPTSAAAECVRTIRTNLLFMSPDRPLRTILVTSSGPGEGKTTTAVSLAETMAGGGSRVLVVDADMRRPRLHKVFGVSGQAGLSALILGDGTIDGAIARTQIPGVDVLPCGPIPPNPAELLHTDGFARLLRQFQERYDRVIIDSPPAGVVADAVVIATQVDGTLLVLKGGETSRDSAVRTTRALLDVKARVFGAVLNDLDLEDARYGEYYYYYRSGYYRDGDVNAQAKPKVA